MPTEPLLSILQAAARLNVSVSTIRRMIKRGEIKGHKVGKLWRFVPDEIRPS